MEKLGVSTAELLMRSSAEKSVCIEEGSWVLSALVVSALGTSASSGSYWGSESSFLTYSRGETAREAERGSGKSRGKRYASLLDLRQVGIEVETLSVY